MYRDSYRFTDTAGRTYQHSCVLRLLLGGANRSDPVKTPGYSLRRPQISKDSHALLVAARRRLEIAPAEKEISQTNQCCRHAAPATDIPRNFQALAQIPVCAIEVT